MKKKDIITFLIVFIIAIISTINFIKPHYSIDTVEFLNNGYETYINSKFLVDGRIFSVILLKLVIDLPMKYVIPILYVIGILISSVAVIYLRNLIKKYAQSEETIFPTIIAYVTIFNFMYIDAFQFMEIPIIAISILLFIISAKLIIEKEKNYLVKSIILLIIAMFCYQGTVNVLITTAFVLTIIKNRKINKEVITDMLKTGILLLAAIFVNYLFTLIVGGTDRIEFNIIEGIIYAIINVFLLMFNSCMQYPQYLQLAIISIITIYCIIKRIKILNIICIYIVALFCNIIILAPTGSGIITSQYGRIFFSIGAIIGYILMYLWCTNTEIRNSKFIKGITILYFISILIIYFQYTYFYNKGQEIDKYIITEINKVISQHEEETGTKIKKYAYKIGESYKQLETRKFLDEQCGNVIYQTVLTGRRILEGISSKIFSLYTNREIEKVFVEDEVFDKYFQNKTLEDTEKIISRQRFVFVEDTVYFVL